MRLRQIPLAGRWLWKQRIRRLLQVVRTARSVQNSDSPFAHLHLCTSLDGVDPGLSEKAFQRLGAFGPAARACVRQRLVGTATYRYLLPELMQHVTVPTAPTAVTAPAEWRAALRSQGVRVAPASVLRWWRLLVLFYAHGLRTVMARARAIMSGRMPLEPAAGYAVLMHMQPNTVPRGPAPQFDFSSWYAQSSFRDSHVRDIWAHVPGGARVAISGPVIVTKDYLPRMENVWQAASALCALLWLTVMTTVRGVGGQWWEVVLFGQLVDFVFVARLRPQRLARAYVFHSARFIVRPLWTYVAEKAGATIDLAFYATNLETFGVSSSQPRPFWPGYTGMTWARYAVWDENQAQLLRDFGHGNATIVIVGPVGFTDGLAPPIVPAGSVAVFDVTPQRLASLAIRGIPQPYYTVSLWSRFMADVRDVLRLNGQTMIYKKKREIGKVADPQFRTALARLRSAEDAIAVDPDVAAQHVIRQADAVVSMPFTSTALVARAMGKASVYYDPLGVLAAEPRLAHGVPVIGTKEAFSAWLHAVTFEKVGVAQRSR